MPKQTATPTISVDQFMQQRAPVGPMAAHAVAAGAGVGGSVDDFMRSRTPQPPPAPDEERTLGGFAGNVVSSTARLIGGAGEMLIHPFDTVRGITQMALGAGAKITGPDSYMGRELESRRADVGMSGTNPFDELLDNMKERYGGLENLKKTAYEDPAGLLSDFAALASGVGEGLSLAGKASRIAKVARAGSVVSKASRYVDPINLTLKGTAGIGRNVGAPIARGAGKLASEAMGLVTGTGGDAIRTAFNSPSIAFKEALRGDVTIDQIADKVKAAVQQVRKQRGNEYRARLSGLQPMDLDMRPVQQQLIQELNDFKVKLTPVVNRKTGATTIVPDFQTSKLGDVAAQNQVRKVIRDVLDWPSRNNVPVDAVPHEMLDTLKQRLDAYYGQTSDARALTSSVRGSVRQVLSQVPGYNEMTSAYETATRFLDEVEPELSAKRTTMKGTTVRKLTHALNQANEYRQTLVDALDTKTRSQIHDQLAGAALHKWAPRGLMRTVAGHQILYAMGIAFQPSALLSLALTSPRLVGEMVSGAGDLKKMAGGQTLGRAGRIATAPGVYRPAMLAAHPETAQPTPPPAQEYKYVDGRLVVVPQR